MTILLQVFPVILKIQSTQYDDYIKYGISLIIVAHSLCALHLRIANFSKYEDRIVTSQHIYCVLDLYTSKAVISELSGSFSLNLGPIASQMFMNLGLIAL